MRIPTLCHDRRLEPYASCWVCLVKVEKAKGFVPSCGTRVTPGMVITTQAPEVTAARRMALDLLLSNHYGDCKAPCTLTCPSNIDIQGYLGLVANGKAAEAVELIRRDNPMPAVIGRICPRPCEQKCRRNLVEEPLNINGIKRFVADAEARRAECLPGPGRGASERRWLSSAQAPRGFPPRGTSREKGVDVTLYEAMEKAGGMLRYGIPDYRLPPAVLDRAIADMLSMGATLKTGVRLGTDVTLEKLRAENDAVVLAIGAWKGRTLRIPGEDHPAVLSGIDFLRDVNAGKPVKVGGIVAIIGGGNTALDAARCSLRHGATKVTMYYRRTRDEMPASDAEIEEAMEEGIDIQYLAAPVSIQAEGPALKSLTLLSMELGEPDASGRRRPVPVEGSEYSVPVDTIISAVGQYSDTKLLSAVPGLVDDKGNLKADLDTGITPVPGVLVAGDLATGTDIAIRAIAGGKHAARAALAYMDGRTYARPKEFLWKKADFREPAAADFKDTPRASREKPRVLGAESRKKSFVEIESTLTAEQATREAARCLECGCQDVRDCALKQHATEYEASATRFLGEVPIHPVDDSHPFIARDPSKCVLCGRCIRICPGGAGNRRFRLHLPRLFFRRCTLVRRSPGRGHVLHLLRAVRVRLPRRGAHGKAAGREDRAAPRTRGGGGLLAVLGRLRHRVPMAREPAHPHHGALRRAEQREAVQEREVRARFPEHPGTRPVRPRHCTGRGGEDARRRKGSAHAHFRPALGRDNRCLPGGGRPQGHPRGCRRAGNA